MIDFSVITKAVEKLLKDNLSGYTIERSTKRNTSADVAAKENGWIGIRRGKIDYDAYTIGGATPWKGDVATIVEVQYYASGDEGDAEEAHEESVAQVLAVLAANKNLGGTVGTTSGYRIEYQINEDVPAYFCAAIITIISEARA